MEANQWKLEVQWRDHGHEYMSKQLKPAFTGVPVREHLTLLDASLLHLHVMREIDAP